MIWFVKLLVIIGMTEVYYTTLSGNLRVIDVRNYGVCVTDCVDGVETMHASHINCGVLIKSVYTIKVDGRYVAHNVDGPATEYVFKGKTICQFCVDGKVCMIEDMPVDPTLKLMWKLIYGDSNKFGLYNR